ncbi:MAG: prepilin-type N-terminal cleavage/methylation domain-containing protein [Sorangiineae bacterium]|nr:prepilin-type N-terminal cleavage/methylation domain-containing protein [Polyangiaceae bacterium]MEB2324269.1 prepilin-type N-terminal cleavage/methylation domain-containing protein [Sorangiineae bacterium]
MNARRARGFTLVELMAVVVIVGILAAVGVVTMRKYIFGSKSVEALSMIQAIRAAQERWRAENQAYLDVSDTIDTWYPMENKQPSSTYYSWGGGTSPLAGRWRLLNVSVSDRVQFGYTTKAGPAFTAMTPLSVANPPTWPVANGPWYVIQAKGDANDDGVYSMFAASSLNGEVLRQNEGE